MNPHARVMVACVVVGAAAGAAKAAWSGSEGDRNYLGHVVGGALVGLLASFMVVALAFPSSD